MKGYNRLLAVFFFVVLNTMLFGPSQLRPGLEMVVAVLGILTVFAVVFLAVSGSLRPMITELAFSQRTGRPWLFLFILVPAALANVVVGGYALRLGLGGAGLFRETLEAVPLWWAPVTVMAIGFIAALFETAPSWNPRFSAWFTGLFRDWGAMIIGPFVRPVAYWRELRARKAGGEDIRPRDAVAAFGFELATSLILCFLAIAVPIVAIRTLGFNSFGLWK